MEEMARLDQASIYWGMNEPEFQLKLLEFYSRVNKIPDQRILVTSIVILIRIHISSYIWLI